MSIEKGGHFWKYSYPKGKETFVEDDDMPLSVGDIYDQMAAENLLDTFIYDFEKMSRGKFIAIFRDNDHLTFACFNLKGEPLVFASVSALTGRSGLAHFCYFRAGMPERHLLAKEWLHMLHDESGMYSLMGITPRPYRHAVAFAESVGFKRVGILPGACILAAHKGRVCDGVVTICNLNQLQEA